MIKMGDYLYCNKENMVGFTINNYYSVVQYTIHTNLITIEGDNGNWFDFTYENDNDGLSYKDFFKTKKELREEKLQKLLVD